MDEGHGLPAEAPPARALLAAIVDSSFDAIISKTLDGTVTSWNPAAEAIFGYTAAEAVGRSITMLLPPERLHEEAQILARLRRGERVQDFETVRIRKDGRRIDVSLTSSPLRDAEGTIVGASKIVRDITRTKTTSRALADTEARFRAIFDNAFQFVGLLSPDGTVLEVNRAALALGNVLPADVVGQPIWQTPWFALSEHTQEHLRGQVARAAGGHFVRYEVTVSAGSRLATLDFSLRPIVDPDGTVSLIIPEGRDITERKRSELALAASEARLAGIVDSAMDAIITVDDQGLIIVFNDAAASMFRCTGAEARGARLERFIPERFRLGHGRRMAQFGAGGTTSRSMGAPGVIAGLRADGTEFPAEASISHVEIDGHQLFTVIMRDVSELREAQAERRALEGQLREAQKMEAIGTLAGGIAHDFNNIMGSIIGNVGLVGQDLEADHAARAPLAHIERAANRARSVVRQILAFSRRQTQELVNQPVRPIIVEALGLLRATLPAVVRLEAELSQADVRVLVDATQIHQVIFNLCTNAWHALRGSTGRIAVGLDVATLDAAAALRLGALPTGDYAHVWVSDNGCGMDDATRLRVFEPFFTTKPRGEGTGLGLSVVHGIMVGLGGGIAVESAPGRGTTFHLYMPVQPAEAVASDGRHPEADAAFGAGEKVLYIDDDELMVLMVDRLLSRRGFAPVCCQDAVAALAAVRANPQAFDLVVTDFNMPDRSGVEVATEIAAIRPDLPVIVSSGYISEELRESARHAGVRALLAKENSFEELAGLILRVLHGDLAEAATA